MSGPISQFTVTWIDHGRDPVNPPDWRWPNGIDLDISRGRTNNCTVELPYPARRCGLYAVVCKLCGVSGACTTAGRLDDPRSLTMACNLRSLRESPSIEAETTVPK